MATQGEKTVQAIDAEHTPFPYLEAIVGFMIISSVFEVSCESAHSHSSFDHFLLALLRYYCGDARPWLFPLAWTRGGLSQIIHKLNER